MMLVGSQKSLLLWSLLVASATAAADTKTKSSSSSSAPPAFFIQDPTDGLCLAGEEFKRCSIDTLFYVSGDPGSFQIHKRPSDVKEEQGDDGTCLMKKNCNDVTKAEDLKLGKCSHCGAKHWNILGDSSTGYVVTATSAKDANAKDKDGLKRVCLKREIKDDGKSGTKGGKATMIPCDLENASATDLPYTALMLQFTSAAEITSMSSPGARLVSAATDGDKKAIQQMLKDGVDINFKDWDQLNALIPAASNGDMDMCKFLVKEGIDVNAGDKDGITALMEAATMGHLKVAEFLVDNGADVDAKSKSGVTALWLAAGQGKIDIIKLLLKKDADVQVQRSDGLSAVMTAAVGGHVDAVKLLIEAGADIAGQDQEGVTPLMNAAEGGDIEVVKVLIEELKKKADGSTEPLDVMSTSGFTALIIACAQGRTQVVELLLDEGADPNAVAESGVTALMYAASHNHGDVVKVLLEKAKVEIDIRHSNDGTALLEACTAGAGEVVQILVEAGAQVDIHDNDGVTPLMAVASNNNELSQQIVLDAYKAKYTDPAELTEKINIFSFSGGNAVMFAAAAGQVEFAQNLLELGAIVTEQAKATTEYVEKVKKAIEDGTFQGEEPHVDGLTALHVAAQGGHTDMVKLLLDIEGVGVNLKDEIERTPLIMAVKGNYGEIATMLVEKGADPNTPYTDDKGVEHNLLFDSIMVENVKFAKALISNGADIYYTDEKKVTTLLQACHRGLTEISQLLLEKHKENGKEGYINDANEEGIVALIAAASEGHLDVVKLLIEHNADVNVKDKDETTALMAASARGHVDVVKALLEAGAEINLQNNDGHTALMFAYNGKNQVETLWERFNQFAASADGKSDQDGGTGPIIREALDNHTALVDILLKSGADTKIKDKEGHTAKDFDYHPDTDSELLEKEVKKEELKEESKEEL